jgi:hypothetical protein
VTKKKHYKRCTKMGGTKISRKPNENKRLFIIYQKTKFQKLGSLKHERVEKT